MLTVLVAVGALAAVFAAVMALRNRRLAQELEEVLGTRAADLGESLARIRELAERNAPEANGPDVQHVVEAFSQGVVLYDRDRRVVLANAPGSRYVDARHSLALVEATIAEMVPEAEPGGRAERRLDLAGPPKQTFDIAVQSLHGGFVVAVIEDVTERRRLEAVRRDFVANISHELKTPVGAMALLAETMTDEDDPELLARLASRLQHEALRVGHTIDDLLLLSRIEADEELVRGPALVHDVVAEACARVATMAEERRIAIEVEQPEDSLSVVGDTRQLVSALYNLIENALKYSEDGSVVHVRAAAVHDRVEIAVEDHGVGIPARDIERIFERFYRVDKGRSRRTGGTGLGLAIVRHIVNNHGGEVTVRSREGEGSTFTLVLARHRPAGDGASRAAPLEPGVPAVPANGRTPSTTEE